jgi:hypothetical protein
MNPFTYIQAALNLNSDHQGVDSAALSVLQVAEKLYGANTTLGGDINNSVTSLTVANGDWLPLLEFPILIGSERMQVRSRSGNTLTVVRAQGGTSAASHSTGDAVTIPDTYTGRVQEALRRLRDINPHFLATVTQRLNTLAEREAR